MCSPIRVMGCEVEGVQAREGDAKTCRTNMIFLGQVKTGETCGGKH
jgi:hypothetical protein